MNPYERPTDAGASKVTRPYPPPLNGPGRRLAGALLIVNALVALLAIAAAPAAAAGDSTAPFGAGITGLVPALIDIGIGISLVRGSPRLVPWAIVRCVGGVVLAAALHLEKSASTVALQAVLSASLIALLAGQASVVRTVIAGGGAGLCLVAALIGVAAGATGSNPLARVLLILANDIESSPVKRAKGRNASYELTFPNDRWYARKQAAATRDNPAADQWFVRPDKDAHVIVIAEHIAEKTLPIEAYTDAIVKHLQSDASNVEIRSRKPWPAFGDRGRLVEAKGSKGALTIEWRYAVITTYGWSIYLAGFASPENMPAVEADIRSIFDSLSLPDALMNGQPPEVDPARISVVRGNAVPYSLVVPNERWHLRKLDVVHKENPSVDQWLMRPEMDAHVFVVAEEAPEGSVVPLAPYVEAVIGNARKETTRFEVVSREPWAKFPNDGVRLRLSVCRNGVDLEYDYGLYAKGRRAYQVTATSGKPSFPAVMHELAKLVDSFEPPP